MKYEVQRHDKLRIIFLILFRPWRSSCKFGNTYSKHGCSWHRLWIKFKREVFHITGANGQSNSSSKFNRIFIINTSFENCILLLKLNPSSMFVFKYGKAAPK